jgi:cell division protein FtsI (penicillin-binding protein 3)
MSGFATSPSAPLPRARKTRLEPRMVTVVLVLISLFTAVAAQLVRLSLKNLNVPRVAISEPITRTYARPDIVDRQGRLLATDLEAPSLYADPALILDVDEATEKLVALLPELNAGDLRRQLADPTRRFVWIKRGLTPRMAQRIHDLGQPGLLFRQEPKRAYPMRRAAGHLLGAVNVDNRGVAGIERYIDDAGSAEAVQGAAGAAKPAVRLSIDLGVQAGLQEELRAAVERYSATGAAGVILDVQSGEVLASASLPDVDPGRAVEAQDATRLDKLTTGVYELGSIFKAFTIAEAIDAGRATLDTVYDVRIPLHYGRFQIRDLHPLGRPMSVRDIFVHSSNVGAAMLAESGGPQAQRDFLTRMGLTEPMKTEAASFTPPKLPSRWGAIETATISFGHGMAMPPLQFAAASAALVNGGWRITPTVLANTLTTTVARASLPGDRVLKPETSDAINQLMRRNVTSPSGTGRQADVPGYEVGGKTGTAEIPGVGGYQRKAVLASFLAAFPMSKPRYIVLITIQEPQASEATKGQITAGVNAAPTAGLVIARVAPLLGVQPIVRP